MSERLRRPGSTVRVRVRDSTPDRVQDRGDVVATEEPMEMRLGWPGRSPSSLVVTMRTPGADFELATGFLRSEGYLATADDVRHVAYCTDPDIAPEQLYNVVTVELTAEPERPPTERYGAATAACGVCGTQSLDDLQLRGCEPVDRAGALLPADVLRGLPDRLRDAQRVFDRTGGLHASGLFSTAGELVCLREDVGRHNALDKVIGWSVLQRHPSLASEVLVVSGRVGYEIAQKALAAGIAFIAAVGAPSSLAVDLCERFGMTLVGFVRGGRFVVYTGADRLGP